MQDNLAILKNIVLFKDFKEDEQVLKKIDELFIERKAKKGDKIIKEGEVGDELYIIKKGCLSCSPPSPTCKPDNSLTACCYTRMW